MKVFLRFLAAFWIISNLTAAYAAPQNEAAALEQMSDEILKASVEFQDRDAILGVKELEARLKALPAGSAGDKQRLDIYLELADLYGLADLNERIPIAARAAEEAAKRLGKPEEAHIARGFYILGRQTNGEGTPEALSAEMTEQVKWMMEHGSPANLGEMYRLQALLSAGLNQWLGAIAHLTKAEALARAHKDPGQLSTLYRDRAYILGSRGSVNDVVTAYANYFRMARENDKYVDIAAPMYNIATALDNEGYYDLGRRFWVRMREVVDRLNIENYRFYLSYGEMLGAFEAMDDKRVVSLSEEALKLSKDAPERIFPLRVRLAVSLARLGRAEEAERQLGLVKQAIADKAVAPKYVELAVEVPHIEALIRAAKGDPQGAIAELEKARRLMQQAQARQSDANRTNMEAIYDNALLREAATAAQREISHQQTLLTVTGGMLLLVFIAAVGLVLLNRKVRALADAKMRLLINVSHEVRTPLNGILGSLALARESHDDGERRHLLEVAHGSAEMLLVIVNDVLDYARIERRLIELRPEPVRLKTSMQHVVDLMVPPARQKGLDLRLDFQGPEDVWVETDDVRLRQILHNLLHNAIKFTDSGHVALDVAVSPRADGGQADVSFTITDTGVGMAEAELAEIFKRFHQARHEDHKNRGGTGIGLAIVRDLTGILGGQIDVKSARGEGTRFTVKIPLKVVPAPDPASKPKTSVTAGRSLKVLIAEDNPVNQALFIRMVESLGHQVELEVNGRDAVTHVVEANGAAGEGGVDVVLMDVLMPVLDGVDATREIRARRDIRQPAIIALTANAFAEQESACRAAGMNGFLSKPLTIQALRERLDDVVAATATEAA